MLLDELPWSNTCAISWATLPVVPQVKTFFTENVFFWLLPFSSKLSLFSAHVSAEMFKCGRIGRHRNAFLFNNNGKSLKFWPIIKKKKWFYWRHFFLFLACFLVYGGAILFLFLFLPAAMLPCLCISAKNKSGNNTRKGVVFLTPLTLSQNRSRKHRKSHRKASQFDFIVGSYPKFSINIWTENSYEPLKIKVCTHQNQSYMQMVLLSNQTFAILTSSSSHLWILLWCYI